MAANPLFEWWENNLFYDDEISMEKEWLERLDRGGNFNRFHNSVTRPTFVNSYLQWDAIVFLKKFSVISMYSLWVKLIEKVS